MVDKKEVKHIAKLARFSLEEGETEKFQKDFSSILDFFNSIKKVNVSNINPAFYSAGAENRDFMREDKENTASPYLTEKLIGLSPQKKENYIKVKAVF